jgi:arabinofuranosyltransferase
MSGTVRLRLRAANPGEEADRASADRTAWWPVIVPVVVVIIGAWIYRWVDEDAFINFRIIDNLLAGHGLVYNLGERVEVNSDPLWLFTLTLFHEILPFLSLEWLSVVLGLVCTALGFLFGAQAVRRLAAARQEGRVYPLGLLVVAVVAGVWEFATSGLEMSMVFLWLGGCFLLLVRVEARRRGGTGAAVVMGLGTLIRPELGLASVVFLVALLLVMGSPGWSPGSGRLRRFGVPIAAALVLPVGYQVFRMGYYGLVVPNTGLAKAAGASWWSQGFTYLWNFVAPYTLWLPLLLAAVLVVGRASKWWGTGDRLGVLMLATPVVAGLVDLVYVVHVGGDYMHARLLLPAFFAVCLPVFVSSSQLRSIAAVPVVGILVWAVVCAGWLRYIPPPGSLNPQVIFISNERNSWITATKNAHPITANDYRSALSGEAGAVLQRLARQVPDGQQTLLVVSNPYAPISAAAKAPARSPLPFTLAVDVPAIGVIGYLAGPDVYIFDDFSLANPIGSHTIITTHARPGHEKSIGPVWMVARFGLPSGPSSSQPVSDARQALTCAPLSSYLHAITAPLSFSQAVANFAHSFSYTSMSFSADPTQAVRQLCGPAAIPRQP